MTFFVRKCLMLFLVLEIVLFGVMYGFGPKGLKALSDICFAQAQTRQTIEQLQQEIVQLQHDIEQSKTSFFKEKVARERLLMKQESETVYFNPE